METHAALSQTNLPTTAVVIPKRPGTEYSKEIESQLQQLRELTLPIVSAEVKKSLDFRIMANLPPDSIMRPDLFEKFARPFVLSGREDLGKFLFFSGLTVPGYSFFDFSAKLFDRCGVHSEAYPLKGQSGNWADFRSATFKMWVDDILQIASSSKEPPVIFSFSTSVLAALEAWNKNPGYCRAIIAIGAPVYLRNQANENLMKRIRLLAYPFSFLPSLDILKFVSTRFPRGPVVNKHDKRCPQFLRLPVSTAIELSKAQEAARKVLTSKTLPPLMYVQGARDTAVSEAVWHLFRSDLVCSPLKVVPELYDQAAHCVQTGSSMKMLLRDTADFLGKLYRFEGFDEASIPQFDKRGHFMRHLKNRGKLHA